MKATPLPGCAREPAGGAVAEPERTREDDQRNPIILKSGESFYVSGFMPRRNSVVGHPSVSGFECTTFAHAE